MKRLAFAIAIATLQCVPGAANASCDRVAAIQLQTNIAALATWKEKGNSVEVVWDAMISEQGPAEKRKLVEAFANSDACIKGEPRDIKFYDSKQKLMAYASPTAGIMMVSGTKAEARAQPTKGAGGITVRGRSINVGMTSDDVVALLKKSELVSQEIKADPKIRDSLVVTKHFKAEGKNFVLVLARRQSVGPYVVVAVKPGATL